MAMQFRVCPYRSIQKNGVNYSAGELVELADADNIDSLLQRGYVVPVDAPSAESASTEPVELTLISSDGDGDKEGDTGFISSDDDEAGSLTSDKPQIDINSASRRDLTELDGIGPKSAMLIEENRPYSSFDEVPEKAGLSTAAANDWPKNRALVIVGEIQ